MTKATIYHNPRCSKSRQTLALLEEQGVDTEIIDYLTNPPNKATLKRILLALTLKPRELMRPNEKPYSELNLDNDQLTEDQLIAAMIENPILIQRPIVVVGEKAAIGRPPEDVLRIIY